MLDFFSRHIFELVLTLKNLWLKKTELEARETEPGRYHNRGGQLLREEKERKTIDSKVRYHGNSLLSTNVNQGELAATKFSIFLSFYTALVTFALVFHFLLNTRWSGVVCL